MFKTIKYFSTLAVVGLSLTACSDGIFTDSEEYTISGTGEKSPLEMAVTLKDAYHGASTRAFDTKFENSDVLIAYVQQVKGTMSSDTPPVFTLAEDPVVISSIVEFTVKEAGNGIDVVKSENHSTQIYWDDFSSTTNDIRDYDRYLRVGYGFCYNGRTASDYSKSEDGTTVTWTVNTDQTSGIKTSDLLWAGPQDVRHYNHDSFKPGATDEQKKAVILPVVYEHAMSKVTLELVLADGFENITTEQINAIAPKLYANVSATVKADTKKITPTVVSAPGTEISMFKVGPKTENSKTYYVYEALIAPTAMVDGKKLAELTVAGNKYELNLTTAMLGSTDVGNKIAWGTQLESDGTSHPGVNYHLVATLKKQRIEVEAMILPWNDVYAAGDGTISFDADVAQNGDLDEHLTAVTAGSFDLWRATSNVESEYDYDTTTEGINKASTYEYSGGKWQAKSGDNILYWENQSTSYYFRALAKANYDGSGSFTGIETVDGSTSVSQSNRKSEAVDLLWAQTSEHKGLDANGNAITDTQTGQDKFYGPGAAIDPRTGNVPLTFKHAMSKISVNLQTSTVEAERVDLTGATISIINLYNGGTINVSDGKIVNMSAPDPTADGDPMTVKGIAVTDMKDYLVIPQSLVNLEDGTERTSTPVFYSADQLTAIYPDADSKYGESSKNSSIGTGEATYYLTNGLNPVAAVYYNSEITEDVAYINSQNALLTGAVSTSSIKEPVVTQVDYDYAGFVTDKKHQSFTQEQFALLTGIYENARLKRPSQPAVDYSYTELHSIIENDQSKYVQLPAAIKAKQYTLYEYNELHKSDEGFTALTEDQYASLPDKDKRNENDLYSVSEFIGATGELQALFESRFNDSSIDGSYKIKSSAQPAEYYDYDAYIALESITNDMFTALPADLKIKTPYKAAVYYTQDEADEYNASLLGAIHVGDIKIPAHYVLPTTGDPLTPHAPGSLQTIGNKIMLYVFLQDGTRYSAELSKCLQTTGTDAEGNTTYGQAVEEWMSNHHYTYTITLAKEKISLRALVKDWEEKHVGGSATLDW